MRTPCLLLFAFLLWPGTAAAADLLPYWNARFGSPYGPSAGLGLAIGHARGEGFDLGKGSWLIEAEAGKGAGAASLGYAPLHAGKRGFQFAGVALKATVVRTWSDPYCYPAHHTFVGAELHAAWIVKGSIGALWRVAGNAGRSVALTWGVGFGL